MNTLLKEVRGQLIQAKSYRDRLEELLRDSLMPYPKLVSRLTAIPGVKELSALKIVSEIGGELSKFRNIEAFCSWKKKKRFLSQRQSLSQVLSG